MIKEPEGWTQIGTVGVDTGRVIIADPIYAGSGRFSVVIPSGYGDGFYPVYAKTNDGARVTEIRIVFIEEEQ